MSFAARVIRLLAPGARGRPRPPFEEPKRYGGNRKDRPEPGAFLWRRIDRLDYPEAPPQPLILTNKETSRTQGQLGFGANPEVTSVWESAVTTLTRDSHLTKFSLNSVRSGMKLSMVKPISYFKAHAAELLDGLEESQEPIAITQNGEVKAVVQDAASFERTQETLALLRLMALGRRDIEQGRTTNMREAIAERRRSPDS